MQPGDRLPGRVVALLVVGVLSLASSAILIRFAQEGPALAIATWRTGLAVVLLAPAAFLRSRSEMRQFSRRDWLLISGAGILLGLHFVAWIESLYHTTVASSTVLGTTSPIFLAVFGFLFIKEILTRRVVIAIIIGVCGSALIGLGDGLGTDESRGSDPLLGNLLALSAAVLFSFYLLLGRIIRRKTSWLAYVFPLYSIAALSILAVAALRGVPIFGYSPLFYVFCLLMAVFPQIIGHGSFNYALRYIPAAILALLTLLEPIMASTAAYFLFGETPYWLTIVGMGFVLGGVGLAVYRRPRVRQLPGVRSVNRSAGKSEK